MNKELIECYVDFNTSTMFLQDFRVVVDAERVLPCESQLRSGLQIRVNDGAMEAIGILEWNEKLGWWEAVIEPGSLHDI